MTKHGGKREGAGRKGFNEPTKVMRIPESAVPTVKDMLDNILDFRRHTPASLDAMPAILDPVKLALPLMASPVQAGFPSPADDYIENALDLNEHFINSPASTFFVRATGDSMNKCGIFDNTILSVDFSLTAKHGDIVIAFIDNAFTLKRLYKKGNIIELYPESTNPQHRVLRFTHDNEVTIWGVVSGWYNKP